MKEILIAFALIGLQSASPTPSQLHPSRISPDLPSLNIFPFQPMKRVGFFADSTLSEVRRSFKDIQSNVERSMSSLFEVGSAIGQRMLGMITRAPRLIGNHPPAQHTLPHTLPPAPVAEHHHPIPESPQPQSGYPNFEDCDCHFSKENEIPKFHPYEPSELETNNIVYDPPVEQNILEETDTYGSPAAPVKSSYSPPNAINEVVTNNEYKVEDIPVYIPTTTPQPEYHLHELPHLEITLHHPKGGHNPHVTDILDHDNDIQEEVVIHPGGSQDIDVHKVEVLGAHSVIQAPSAQVPDQSHPEKYRNYDSDLLQDIVEVNLWYKDTKKLKHHKHGHKSKVIPHLQSL